MERGIVHRRQPPESGARANMLSGTRAPTRLDFGGGWTDVPPYPERDGGFVCNLAIARYSTVLLASDGSHPGRINTSDRVLDQALVDAAVRRAGARNLDVWLYNDFPVGAGLGGSSAAGVALAAALAHWKGDHVTPAELAERSRATEVEELDVAGGRQDHYASAFGGALGLRFTPEGTHVERLPMTASLRDELERRCLVVYTGESRISGDTITAVRTAYEGGDRKVVYALRRMKELAIGMAEAVGSADVDALASLVGEHWVHQRALHPAIPTSRIDAIVEQARLAGALGAKALGASGGGCVLVIAPREGESAVRNAVSTLGALLPFTIAEQGVESSAWPRMD